MKTKLKLCGIVYGKHIEVELTMTVTGHGTDHLPLSLVRELVTRGARTLTESDLIHHATQPATETPL
jgi:hypothetical protein